MEITNELIKMPLLYEYTLIILSIESLIMGITLLTVASSLSKNGTHLKLGLIFLSVAMLILFSVNFAEYMIGVDGEKEKDSLSILIFSASLEMFLFMCAYMSMLRKGFVTKQRVLTELGLILIFTTPAIFVNPSNNPTLFQILFIVGIIFYGVKLAHNFYIYKKQVKKTSLEIENSLSDDSELLLKWINHTFYMVIVIGVVSVIVPMTNFTILTIYSIFLFFAYFYIYISVIRNISLFEQSMLIVQETVHEPTHESNVKKNDSIMLGREKFLDDWIANKGYAVAGVTANEVASKLNINRTKLSWYLKNELNTCYYEWIAKLRIEEAKRQLIEYPNRSIYEIALNVGIEDRDNFRRVFQRFVGMSPSAYRKEHTITIK